MSDRLSEIEGRLAAAPIDAGWFVEDGSVSVAHDPGGDSCSGLTGAFPIWADGAADLIAHAPADLAALLAFVRTVDDITSDRDVRDPNLTYAEAVIKIRVALRRLERA